MVNKRNIRRAQAKQNQDLGPVINQLKARCQFLEGILVLCTLRYVPLKFSIQDRKQLVGESKDYCYVSDCGVEEDGTWFFKVTKQPVGGAIAPEEKSVIYRN